MYTAKDISIVIPSYQRAEEVKRTLKEMKKLYPQPREILVVDQSTTENTKKVCNQSKMKNVKYVFSSPPSITIARNVGVKASHKDAKIIVFIDDDVSLDKKYIERIVEVYNKYPGAKGVSGFHCEDEVKNLPFVKKTAFYMERFLRRIFFLGRLEKDQFRLISPYGNIGSYDVTKIINAEWLYGMNMTYKKEVCKEIKFDENLLGYTVAEDTDFSYRVFKKYPNGLFITPYAHAVHRIADNERGNYRKRSFINQVDHFYLFSKHFNNSLKQRIIFVWSLLGIVLLRTLSLFSFKEPQYEKFRYFWVSLAYCISNWSRIKQGKVREF